MRPRTAAPTPPPSMSTNAAKEAAEGLTGLRLGGEAERAGSKSGHGGELGHGKVNGQKGVVLRQRTNTRTRLRMCAKHEREQTHIDASLQAVQHDLVNQALDHAQDRAQHARTRARAALLLLLAAARTLALLRFLGLLAEVLQAPH